MSSEVNEALRRFVADRAYYVCECCLVHKEDVYRGCEVDHIRSVKHGGLSVAENLALACFHCNRHKGTDLGIDRRQSDLSPNPLTRLVSFLLCPGSRCLQRL